ncbi:MAG TPA: hypothetical protein VGF10_13100 [Gaiella sp.]|jgi:hypothetical protein
MRLALLLLSAVAAVVVWRRRRTETSGVVVAWRDGAELEIREGTPEHARIATVARRALG